MRYSYIVLTPETKPFELKPEDKRFTRVVVNPRHWDLLQDWQRRMILDSFILTEHIKSSVLWDQLSYIDRSAIACGWDFAPRDVREA